MRNESNMGNMAAEIVLNVQEKKQNGFPLRRVIHRGNQLHEVGFIKLETWFHRKMPWNDCCATVVTRNSAELFYTTSVSLRTPPWRYVLYSDALNNGQWRFSIQPEASSEPIGVLVRQRWLN
jgi:hypothetical protein